MDEIETKYELFVVGEFSAINMLKLSNKYNNSKRVIIYNPKKELAYYKKSGYFILPKEIYELLINENQTI